jgi:hypothetical protein
MGYEWKHIFSPERWKVVYKWILKKELKRVAPEENTMLLTPNELLQVANRVIMCEGCVQKGKCLKCNCDIGGAMSDPKLSCSDGKWGPMKSEEEMNKYRENNYYNIKDNQLENGIF